MIKTMVFIDGMWLYRNTPKLGEKFGSAEFHVDYGKLPLVLSSQVGAHLSVPTLDTVRTYLFASYPKNYDVTDEDVVQRQLDFFAMLKEEFHYEVELFPINFRGRHIRREDRSPTDKFEPEEKCVDVALATAMLYFAAIPYAYDVAIAVIGDRDYMPVLQHVRRLGKRVGIASIKGACASEYSVAEDTAKLRDMDIIWLDDVLDQIVLRFERQLLECQDPRHRGDRKVWTTFRPRRGRPFYCDACRKRNAEDRPKQKRRLWPQILRLRATRETNLLPYPTLVSPGL